MHPMSMVTVDVSGDPLGTSKYAMTLFIRDHVSPFLEYCFRMGSIILPIVNPSITNFSIHYETNDNDSCTPEFNIAAIPPLLEKMMLW
jgi:hypothetical protein